MTSASEQSQDQSPTNDNEFEPLIQPQKYPFRHDDKAGFSMHDLGSTNDSPTKYLSMVDDPSTPEAGLSLKIFDTWRPFQHDPDHTGQD